MNNYLGGKNQTVIPEAKKALNQFKYEIAREIGVQPPESGYWGNMTSRECGSVGGYMVKRMVEVYENSLIGK
ncbi:spore protein [Fervidicella metallireducens AeB]|uniref:Spore protein n=1 Tax=Fervidicella metallireducens AeB TaxID=1403537 RepID=A0A017RXH3_9CLOT|nr:alpha/beta-type small acid-soluble spore protein [Fervidicella metallireducens]EYE89291.1 spore protein [Fervidicella metallireducens AeB]